MQQTKQHCERVCTQTYTQTMSTGKGAVAVMPVHAGKGKGIGRHLLHKKSLIKGHMLKGKGATGALVDSNCQDVSVTLVLVSTAAAVLMFFSHMHSDSLLCAQKHA